MKYELDDQGFILYPKGDPLHGFSTGVRPKDVEDGAKALADHIDRLVLERLLSEPPCT